jgi:hypothetical protein
MLIFDVNTSNTNGSDAPQLGKIVKTPKNAIAEAFTDADVFVLHFPTLPSSALPWFSSRCTSKRAQRKSSAQLVSA